MKKLSDTWFPKQPSNQIKSIFDKNFVPIIEMKIVKDGVEAKVEFKFIDQTFHSEAKIKYHKPPLKGITVEHSEKAKFKRIIQGPSEEVYIKAAKIASRNGLSHERDFNHRWNRTLLNLLNKPSENKTMINLGTYKPKEQSGLYNIKTPAELLSQKLIDSKIPGAKLAALAGVEESTLYRHLKGMEISRDAAFKYAKVLGCDPSELLFNPLHVPVWGSVDLQEMKGAGDFSVYPGEITGFSKEEYALCPREIYRPDAKAIRIDQENSHYHNHIAFYYNSNEHIPYENQLVVAGVRLKNFSDKQIRFRYFFGIYKKNKNNKTVDILNPDPEALDIVNIEPDEDCNSFEDLKSIYDSNRYVIDDIKPEFVAPVVSLVNHNNIKEKEDFIKDHARFYNAARETDLYSKSEFKKFLLRKYINEKEKEKLQSEVESGTYKYGLTDIQINQKAEEKTNQIFSRINDLYYSDMLNKFNDKLRPDIQIKTDKGIKNFEIKSKGGVTAIREDLSVEEIQRINEIDDHLNDIANYQPEPSEKKRA